MDITRADDDAALLRSWRPPALRIGKVGYAGSSHVVEVLKVTYQQRSTTFGQISGTFGSIHDGHGRVSGGAGYVDTRHEGLISAVLRDADGGQHHVDLPDELALVEGNLLRLDMVNKRTVRATNLSGRRFVRMSGPAAFIAMPTVSSNLAYFSVIGGAVGALTLYHFAAVAAAIGAMGTLGVAAAGLLAPVPAVLKRRAIRTARDERTMLGEYIEDVCR
jgi:hypothetical protein